jgi:predicted nucleic acid-binding protein
LKTIVVDASVAIKWFIPEVHAIDASRLLQKKMRFIAPDLIFAEVGNILWTKTRSKELTLEIATEILDDFKRLPLDIHESEHLLDIAWQIATEHQCTVYDSLYVALAKTEKCLLVTADRALHNALGKTHLARTLLWIEDIKNIS